MKEITRIHIAKISYDIEVAAKKELEKYINKLELYGDDQDWVEDIEVRITEILAERGVEQNGVITNDDVQTVRNQLGDPKDFIDDGDIAVGSDIVEKMNTRRLYRDVDGAILGGVTSGIAKYFGINSVWTRIAFIILLFISFGTVAIVYLVLWLAIPPARTTAEKLQLSGTPITLASIKELHEQGDDEQRVNRVASVMQNILAYGLGTFSAIGAVMTLAFTAAVSIALLFGFAPETPLSQLVSGSAIAWVAYILFIASGILLSALLSIVAIALFRKKLTKKIVMSIVAIIIAGTVTFSIGVGSVAYDNWSQGNRLFESRFTKNYELPEKFKNVKSIVIDTDAAEEVGIYPNVTYIVSTDIPHYEVTLDAATRQLIPHLTYDEKTEQATLKVTIHGRKNLHRTSEPTITIYGPALKTVTIESGSLRYENLTSQDDIQIIGKDDSFELIGSYKSVSATAEDEASITLDSATIHHLNAGLKTGYISAGVVSELTISQGDSCPINNNENRLIVRAVSSGKMSYNGTAQDAKNHLHPCGNVIIGEQ